MLKGIIIMDNTDMDIIRCLQEDARLTMTAIGKAVGLSQPAVAERIKRLEEQGVIEKYTAIISSEKIGKPITAFMLVRTTNCIDFINYCANFPQIVECHRISGQYNYLIKIQVESTKALEEVENSTLKYGTLQTLFTLSSPIPRKPL